MRSVLVLSLFALAGCPFVFERDHRHDADYSYCDETGCWACNDWECWSIGDPSAPGPGSECRDDWDCRGGYDCVS